MLTQMPATRPLPIIRVFVSSTFNDLKHERNALQADVWPVLEDYCRQRGFTFQAIDLRWGVPGDAALDHRTMRICFEELRRSQLTSLKPNFLILLGNRYGLRPLPEVISVAEYEKLETAAIQIASAALNDPTKDVRLRRSVVVLRQWYRLDENARPFGRRKRPGEYVLRPRTDSPDEADYTELDVPGAKPKATPAWLDVQFVLREIVNRAFPAADLAARFKPRSSKRAPSIVRFQASATEQEIWHGALQVADAKRHVLACYREIDDLDARPNQPPCSDFMDLKDDGTRDDDARQTLVQLKARLEAKLGDRPDRPRIIRTKCQWALDENGNPSGDVTEAHVAGMCSEIRRRLKKIIRRQINAYWGCEPSADDATLDQIKGSPQELDLECAAHRRFASERAPVNLFVGREAEGQLIHAYLQAATNQPHVVQGPSGCGKTALLGKVLQEVTPPPRDDGTRAATGPIVLARLIGTTSESSSVRSLLSSLCRELRRVFPVETIRESADGDTETFSPPVPTEMNQLMDEFYTQLGRATAARPIYIFLDAVDQLDSADDGRAVNWIRSPLVLPPDRACHARLVVSCLSPSREFPKDSEPCEPFRQLKARQLLDAEPLGSLNEKDARRLFASRLRDAGRDLAATQRKTIRRAIRRATDGRQPLFLKILSDEACRWQSFDQPLAIPRTLTQLLEQVIVRLEGPLEHDRLVRIALSYLVSARYGLSEGELLEVLFQDPEYEKFLSKNNEKYHHDLPPKSTRIPIALWARLRSDLAPYLAERAAPGTAVLNFYHRQVAEVVRMRYLQSPEEQVSRRRQLAKYFDGLPGCSVRLVSELPWLLERAQNWASLEKFMTTLERMTTLDEWRPLEWQAYWRHLIDASVIPFDVESVYQTAWKTWHDLLPSDTQRFGAANRLAHALSEVRRDSANLAALAFFEKALTFVAPGDELPLRLAIARVQMAMGDFPAAQLTVQRAYVPPKGDGPKYITNSESLRSDLILNQPLTLKEAVTRVRQYFHSKKLPRDEEEALYCTATTALAGQAIALADGLNNTGQPKDAVPLLRDAIEVLEGLYGTTSSELSTALNNLGLAFRLLGRNFEAETTYLRALAIDEATLPPNDWRIAIKLRNLGCAMGEQGLYNAARNCLREAIRIDESNYDGLAHPRVALGWHNYGEVAKQQGDLIAAEEAFRRALEAEVRSHRDQENHPLVAMRLLRIAGILAEQGRFKDAHAEYDRAVEMLVATQKMAASSERPGELALSLSPDHQGVLSTIGQDIFRTRSEGIPSTARRMEKKFLAGVLWSVNGLFTLGILQEFLAWLSGAQTALQAVALVALGFLAVPALAMGIMLSGSAFGRAILYLSLLAATGFSIPWDAFTGAISQPTAVSWGRWVVMWCQMLLFCALGASLGEPTLERYLDDKLRPLEKL